MVRDEGPSSLARGLTPNVFRAILMNASQLASYDFFKSELLKTSYFEDNMVVHVAASLGAVCFLHNRIFVIVPHVAHRELLLLPYVLLQTFSRYADALGFCFLPLSNAIAEPHHERFRARFKCKHCFLMAYPHVVSDSVPSLPCRSSSHRLRTKEPCSCSKDGFLLGLDYNRRRSSFLLPLNS